MSKIKDKFIKYVNKHTDEFAHNTSQVIVETTLKKDLFNKSRIYKEEILRLYPIFLDNYVLICGYLYYDFNIKTTKLNEEMTDLSNEINIKKQCKKIIKESPNRKIRFLDKYKFNKLVKKWWILSTILKNYKDALIYLKDIVDENIYKEIDIKLELENHEKYKYLIDDFTVLENA